VATKTKVGELVIHGSTSSIFTADCNSVWTGVLSRTARRIGFGLCGREKSGTLIPTQTRNNGIMRVMKRRYRLCFTNIFIASTYQTLIFNTSLLNFYLRCERLCARRSGLLSYSDFNSLPLAITDSCWLMVKELYRISRHRNRRAPGPSALPPFLRGRRE
jgi:hypothetical protein